MQRRELFSALFSKKKEAQEILIRPPYGGSEALFLEKCLQCIDTPCITSCEENIIVLHEDQTPKIDFSKGGCTYCDACAVACPHLVLSVENKSLIDIKIEIDPLKCMSWNETMCFSCKDPCLDDAIEFLGIFRPSINENKCTNCGFCINVCPTNAIKTIKREIKNVS